MSSTALSVLPPKVAGTPAVQRIQAALTSTRASNRALREEAASAQSPMLQTLATQGGSVIAAGLAVFVPADKAPLAIGAVSALCLGYGLVTGTPAAISVANGVLSPLTFEKAREMFSKQKSPAVTTSNSPASE